MISIIIIITVSVSSDAMMSIWGNACLVVIHQLRTLLYSDWVQFNIIQFVL